MSDVAAEFDPKRFTVIDHPLVQHKMHILRDKATATKQFRELVSELAIFEGYEAMRDLPLEDVEVETPLETATCKRLAGKKVAIIPILRAGLGMVDGLLTLVPSARVGHVGMYRDPETHEPHEYYCKLPEDIANRTCLVVDPMLATGGSLTAAIKYLRDAGARDIRCLVLVAAPEGVRTALDFDPDIRLYTCALDRELNDHAYILPGLGDAGDRIFGTK
ncbi:MAG: uracil phosphoribosyltransferase [Coriobacteriia bacterium]|nr:uracil phosphoribosyltransferase [Coriobacteriia bacterium]MBS5477218.1 uracil phosphoribosyltransferase [Coriobacteriia bacterium]